MLALAAIFGADYEAAADGRGFTLRVSPHAGCDAAVSGAGAALEIRYPDSYPSAPPTLTVWPLGGLPQGACDALAADLRQVAAASAGDVCAFALATRAADWLADECIELLKNKGNESPEMLRLRIETRQWLCGVLYPERYGKRVINEGTVTYAVTSAAA